MPKDVLGNPLSIPAHDSSYDGNFVYRGNPTIVASLSGAMSYAYDIGGNPYETQDGDGMIVTVATSSSTGASLPATLTPNGNGNLASNMTYSGSYALTSVSGANGANQSVSYDAYNRPGQATSVDGAITAYTYTYAPNTQTATISTTVNNTTTTQWRRTTFDGFGRAIKVETGHDGTTYNTVDTVYGACGCSPLGKVMRVSMPYAAGETEVWTTYTYDGSGRQLTSTVPDGSVTATAYAGNSVTTTDPAGIWKKNVTDAFGNLTAVYEPDPATGSATTGPVTNYTYNGANQLTNVSMVRGTLTQTRTFTYSGSDLASETTPEAGTVTYSYDGNHHVTQRTDALGQQTQYSYDAYERLVEVRHYVGGTEQTRQRVDYVYDTPIPGGYTQNYTWGRLSAVVFQGQTPFGFDLDFAYEYSYNQAGRVTGNRMLTTPSGETLFDLKAQYAWDNQGRMTSMTYPSGPAMTYAFDPMGRPSTMTQNQSFTAAAATYGSAGQLLTLGGETLTYNSMLQLTRVTGGMPGSSIDIQYIYSTGHNNGRVTQTIDGILGETVNYQYDYLHRLTAATATNNAWGEAYSYDGFGNLTAKTPTVGSAPTFSGSAGSNAQNGALGGQWDVENRPMTQGSTFYVYDPWGRRIWKQWTGQDGRERVRSVFLRGDGPETGELQLRVHAEHNRLVYDAAKGSTRTSGERCCRRRACSWPQTDWGACARPRTAKASRTSRGAKSAGRGRRMDGRSLRATIGISRDRITQMRGITRRRRRVFGVRIRGAFTPPIRVPRTAGTAIHMPEAIRLTTLTPVGSNLCLSLGIASSMGRVSAARSCAIRLET